MSSRPTKILKISAFRDFFVTEPKCQKGAKNRVKTRFLRRISILCSSYVPLTQSGYFRQNVMTGMNSCRESTSSQFLRLNGTLALQSMPCFHFLPHHKHQRGFIPLKYQHCDRLRPNCNQVAIRSQLISKRPLFELLYNIPLRPIGFPYADNFLVLFQFSHQHLYLVTIKPR